MQDLEDGVRLGRGRLSAIPGEAGTKVKPFIDEIAVVPGGRLLEMASALSEGATLMHARLRHLDPEDRDAILDLMAGQMTGLVNLWADLVRAVVPTPALAALPGTEAPARADEPVLREEALGDERGAARPQPVPGNQDLPGHQDLPSTEAHPSARARPAPPTVSDVRRSDEVTGDGPVPDAGPGPRPGVRRLPRRDSAVLRRQGDPPEKEAGLPNRELWATPLRSVKVEEPEDDYEGDRLTHDELTGVLNRQAGFAALGRELDRCRRAGERFVLGYLDVDGLKDVNSIEGPRGGDELLRKVTAALRATLRSYDVIMRLGADEFLFSLPGADMATAELRAHEFGVILAGEAPGRTASVGFGELRANDTLDEIISRAEIELVKGRRSRVRTR